jgi:hypothetical protein
MPMRQEVRPGIDIAGSISGLGDALQQGMEFGQKRRVDKATRAALAQGLTTGPDGLPDYMSAAGNILAGGGDTDTALTLARLAEAQNERNWQHSQPIYRQGADGGLYDMNPQSPTYSGGTGASQPQPQPRQRQAPPVPQSGDPGDLGGYEPTADAEQPAQTADASQPGLQPVIPGKKQPPKTTTIYKDGQPQVVQFNEETGQYDIPLGGQKAPTVKARSLSSAAVGDLTEAGQNAQDINRLQTTWSDDYAGYGIGGEVANLAGSHIPGSKYADQSQWWADYANRRNDLRHSKFGASLTPGEKSEFAKADINPNMQPPVIKANLARQQAILNNAAKRLAKVWIKQGYSADAISEAVGFTPEELGVAPQADTEAPVPGSTENAAPAGDEPEPQDNPQEDAAEPQQQEQGQVVQMNDGRRFRLMPDGTVIQLD